MEKQILEKIGIDPFYLFLVLFILVIAMFFLLVRVKKQYDRLRSSYQSFMKGKDGKTLESSIRNRFAEMDKLVEITKQNRKDIRQLFRNGKDYYQKVGIVKYDAFNEMGGKLSFALALLDGRNNGWIINAMHSREGCYTYIKEIVKGTSYTELAEEESAALEMAIYQEVVEQEE